MAVQLATLTIARPRLVPLTRRRAPVCPVSGQSPPEELVNVLTHGLGMLLSIAGASVLIALASVYGNSWHIVSSSIFGATLIMAYAASTLYHSAWSVRSKRFLRDVDQAIIYLLIAGTYTPFTLGPLNGGWGWSLFGVVWGIAAVGVVSKAFCQGRCHWSAIPMYLGLGWLCLVGIVPLFQNVPLAGLLWLFAGGAAYSLGAVFVPWRKLPFHHAIWHCTVLLGSLCHYFAVLLYVVL